MENYILETYAGDTFKMVAEEARSISIDLNRIVEFDFNEIKCLVNQETDIEWLYRDYCNAHRMEWHEVGPYCVESYSPEVQSELERRNKTANERQEKQRQELEAKDKKERDEFESKVKGVWIELTDVALWDKGKTNNTDPYGACIYKYAEGWARLMQLEIKKGKSIIECAESTSHQLGFLGITGFMYGAAVSILSACWKHGEELRKWHNKEYDHEGDGVVNPAILIIN